MKLLSSFGILIVSCLVLSGCRNGSNGDDGPSEFCSEVCDALEECHAHPESGPYDQGSCEAICDDLDEEEVHILEPCNDNLSDLFECVSGANCGTLVADLEFGDIEIVEDFILQAISVTGCDDKGQDAFDECELEFNFPVDP